MARRQSQRAAQQERDNRGHSPSLRRLSLGKKVLFASLTFVVILALTELILAALGVRPALSTADPYVGFSAYVPLFIEERGDDGRSWMVTAENKLPWFNEQRFPLEKPADTVRVFSIGGSTTFGRPYDDTTSFTGWLRAFLNSADSSHQWDVINAGGVSYASYRLAKMMEELVRYEPDLFIIYTGHNEFLEDRTYQQQKQVPGPVQAVGALLGRTRTYAAVARVIQGPQAFSQGNAVGPQQDLLPAEVETLLDSAVGLEAYRRDDKLRQRIYQHFELNLRRMIGLAREAGAEVLLVTPAANLRDCAPFKSEHRTDLPGEVLQGWQRHYLAAQDAADEGDFAEALEAAQHALQIDDRVAALHYLRGQLLLGAGQTEEAGVAFERALEEDVCPLRAPSRLREIVRQVASEEDVPVVDWDRYVRQQAEFGIPGEEQFLDHVHPTIPTHRQLALLLLEKMLDQKLVQPDDDWDEAAVERITQQIEQSIDEEEHAAALRNLSKVLSWAGKRAEADRLALKAIELLPDDVEAQHQAGNAWLGTGEYEKALAAYQRAIAIDPSYVPSYYGIGLVHTERNEREEAVSWYERALQIAPDFVDARFNLALHYEQLGELEMAEEQYREVARQQPRDATVLNSLAIVLAKRGKTAAAREHFEKALTLNPQFADAYSNLGMLLEGEGKTDEAIRYFRRSLQVDPGNQTAAESLQRLNERHD